MLGEDAKEMLKGGNASRQYSFGIYNPSWTIFPKLTAV